MSVYSTPCQQIFDEEVSSSEDSVYGTPKASFSDSVFDRFCATKSVDTFDWKSEKAHIFSTPLIQDKIDQRRKCMSDSRFDKENIGRFTSNVTHRRKSNEGTMFKCITSTFTNADQRLNLDEKTDNSELSVKMDNVTEIKKSHEDNTIVTKSTQSNFFRRLKLIQKFKTKCGILKEKISVDGETILIRIPKSNYGSISLENTNVKQKPQSSPKLKSQFASQTSSFSVLKKCRFVYLKRLFNRSITNIRSCYAKYLERVQKNQYQSLDPVDGEPDRNVPEVNIRNSTEQLKIVSTPELLHTVISKLSSMENDLKELKSLVKESNNRGSITCFPIPPPPPPPPPPPLPSNVMNYSCTPKRKVDLTTPENQQLAKRPSRVQDQRSQFSVTVEDLRNVKLRKIRNSIAKRSNVDENSIKESMSLPSSTRTTVFRYKRNRIVDKKLSEIAAELLTPRSSTDIPTEVTPMCFPVATVTTPTNPNIFEQTPKRTKRGSSLFRKRKELRNESPARKRLNSSGLSSPRSYNSISDN